MSILLTPLSFLIDFSFQILKKCYKDYAGETKPNKVATRSELSLFLMFSKHCFRVQHLTWK